jgi:hypothetical protein
MLVLEIRSGEGSAAKDVGSMGVCCCSTENQKNINQCTNI